MPELPEVETVRRHLQKVVKNKIITDVFVKTNNIVRELSNEEFSSKLINQKIQGIGRIGKYLIVKLGDYDMYFHFRMEGKLLFENGISEITKHDHVIFKFKDKTTLIYNDVRKFGTIDLIPKGESFIGFDKLGIEPHNSNLTVEYLSDKLNSKTQEIKKSLLDQTIISGLGNIYVDEVLFCSGVSPLKKSNKVTRSEINKIIKCSNEIIENAINAGGTTIRSYVSKKNTKGAYQNNLLVYKREGQKCLKCGRIIMKIKIGGRGTHFCPRCQNENSN